MKKNVPARMPKISRQIGVGGLVISERGKAYVNDVLDSHRLTYGKYTETLERRFAEKHGVRWAIMMNSGTSALHTSVACLKEVWGWQAGDEVLLPAVTFVATANVVIDHGLRPVFVDVDPATYNIDVGKIEEKITPRTRAIMPVHLFGQPCDMEPVLALAKKHNLRVLEDSCETMFARYRGQPVGSFGDIACFSTYAAHLLVTGVGGFAVTDNPDYAMILKSLANHGRDSIYLHMDADKNLSRQGLFQVVQRRFNFERLGYSFRATEMEAALGLAQLEEMDDLLSRRIGNANFLINNLKPFDQYLQLPHCASDRDHVYMVFPVVVKDPSVKKGELVMFLEENNIETRDMMPLLNQPVYRKLFGNIEDKYPVAKHINQNGFYIGCHPHLTQEELKYIVAKFGEFFNSYEI